MAFARELRSSISIHALREESDNGRGAVRHSIRISIHALREESDLWLPRIRRPDTISIHALREESDLADTVGTYGAFEISIHALREESDSKNREKTPCFCLIIHLSAQIAKRCL